MYTIRELHGVIELIDPTVTYDQVFAEAQKHDRIHHPVETGASTRFSHKTAEAIATALGVTL